MFRYAPIKKIERWGNIDLFRDVIKKSFGRFFYDEETGKLVPISFNIGDEHHNKEDGTDHSPVGFDPRTNEVTDEWGRHPIDALADEVARLYERNTGKRMTEEFKIEVMDDMISNYNDELTQGKEPHKKRGHYDNHSNVMQGFTHPEHRRNHHGEHKNFKDFSPFKHSIRSKPSNEHPYGHKVNYLNQKGNVLGGDQGEWIDSGFLALTKDNIVKTLETANQRALNEGEPQPFANWDKQSNIKKFTKHIIPLHLLSDNNIISLNKNEANQLIQNNMFPHTKLAGKIGPDFQVPQTDHIVQDHHSSQIVNSLPHELFLSSRRSGGPKPTVENIRRIAQLMRTNHPSDDVIQNMSNEELYNLSTVPAFRQGIGGIGYDNKDKDSKGARRHAKVSEKFDEENLINFLDKVGVDRNLYLSAKQDIRYITDAATAKGGNAASRDQLAALHALQQHFENNPDPSNPDAFAMAQETMRNSLRQLSPEEQNIADENRLLIMRMIKERNPERGFHGSKEHEITGELRYFAPRHEKSELSPLIRTQRKVEDFNSIPDISEPIPEAKPLSVPTTPAPPLPYLPPQYLPPSDEPDESWNEADVKTASENTMQINAADSIRKQLEGTLEKMQYNRAKNNRELLKSLPSTDMDLNSINDVRVFSHQFGVANMDVHGIMSSQGDWTKIAKQWNMPLQTVEAIKLAFGGI